MKIRKTHKEIKSYSGDILAIGYCDAQFLLSNHRPLYYTAGIYGWNYDVYCICGDTYICTGYRNMPGRKPRNLREYERKAEEIWNHHEPPYTITVKQDLTERLLIEFLMQA